MAEIEQAKEDEVSQQKYFEIIEGKTALFMSACCKLGATLAAAWKEDIAALVCGLYWGWLYKKEKSLVPIIISHALWDLTIFVLFPVMAGGMT